MAESKRDQAEFGFLSRQGGQHGFQAAGLMGVIDVDGAAGRRGRHDDRHGADGSEHAEQLGAVEVGQAEVEDNKVGAVV